MTSTDTYRGLVEEAQQGLREFRYGPGAAMVQRLVQALASISPEEGDGSGEDEPVAWLHTMHYEEDAGSEERVTLDEHHGSGRAGADYDASYRITSEPLFTRLPAPATQAQREAMERLIRNVLVEHPYELKGGWRLTSKLVEAFLSLLESRHAG